MLFVFISAQLCPTWFACHSIFVSFKRNTTYMLLEDQKHHTFPKRHISSSRFSGGCVAHSFLFSFVDYYWYFRFLLLFFSKFHNNRWLLGCESSFHLLQLWYLQALPVLHSGNTKYIKFTVFQNVRWNRYKFPQWCDDMNIY